MASFEFIAPAEVFPAGQAVAVYPEENWATSLYGLPPRGAPPGSSVASGSLSSTRRVTFTGLSDGAPYFVAGQVGSEWRYVGFETPAAVGGGGGGGAVDSVNGAVGVVVLAKADVGLGNVDNTADTAKPVSTAQQAALDAKLATTYLDTDGTLAANSDAKIASQKAVRTYVAANAASVPDADATTKGKVQLVGGLGGTAASPTVRRLQGQNVARPVERRYDLATIIPPVQPTAQLAITTWQGGVNACVEPSVLYVPDGWGADSSGKAWRYWMTFGAYNSPFTTENPSLRVSDDGITWVLAAGCPDPVVATPADGNHCDPQLFFDETGDTMYLSWTTQARAVAANNGVFYKTSTDGITWSAATKLIDTASSLSLDLISTRFQFYRGLWHCWTLDLLGGAPNVVRYRTATTLAGLGAATTTACTGLAPTGGSTELFEFEVKRVQGEWMMLIQDRASPGHLYLCTSLDGIAWSQSVAVMTGVGGNVWNSTLYKGGFVAVDDGHGIRLKIWYSAVGNTTGTSEYRIGYVEVRNGPNMQTSANAAGLGIEALRAAGSAPPNRTVAVGYQALRALTTGTNNTAVGNQTLTLVTTGVDNTAIGNSAMKDATGQLNVAVGSSALQSVTANANTAVGYLALSAAVGGPDNTGIGYSALGAVTSGSANVGVGRQAGWNTTTAQAQTAVGYQSGTGGATQYDNIVAVGYQARTDGAGAIALGRGATASAAGAVAIGRDSGGTSVTTSVTDQIALGTASQHLLLKKAAAPADASLAASQFTFWLDATNGAAKLMVKAKQADGTVVSGNVALA